MTKAAFVCVGNAGRSQMATALAEQERGERGLEDDLEIVTGGVDPREHVHAEVVEALAEEGIDISDRAPRKITADDVADADYVVTMGCDAADIAPDGWDGETERWALSHPDGDDEDAVRTQRDEIERRVREFFDRVSEETRDEH